MRKPILLPWTSSIHAIKMAIRNSHEPEEWLIWSWFTSISSIRGRKPYAVHRTELIKLNAHSRVALLRSNMIRNTSLLQPLPLCMGKTASFEVMITWFHTWDLLFMSCVVLGKELTFLRSFISYKMIMIIPILQVSGEN